jgi:hypothetical protein
VALAAEVHRPAQKVVLPALSLLEYMDEFGSSGPATRVGQALDQEIGPAHAHERECTEGNVGCVSRQDILGMRCLEVMADNRGSDGRNPTWSHLDLYLVKSLQPFADSNKRIELTFNVVNLFNQGVALRSFRQMNRESVGLWTPGDDPGLVLNGYDYMALMEG